MQGVGVCNLKVHVNGQHTFLVHESTLCAFSGKMKAMVSQERKRKGPSCQPNHSTLKITDFPGGPAGFELASRFCYSGGRVTVTPANVCVLHSSAVVLEMNDGVCPRNLLSQTETFMDGLFYWTWGDILAALKGCDAASLPAADASGLLYKLVSALLAKISPGSDEPALSPPSSPCFGREWWFDDLTFLPPAIIGRMVRVLGAYGSDNKDPVLTRFLLHYLTVARSGTHGKGTELGGLADTAVHGVIARDGAAFSCKGLFRVLRVVSGAGIGRECRQKLEKLIGLALDQAALDDLLVSAGHYGAGGVYDVSLVVRLVGIFVGSEEGNVGIDSLQRMRRLGRLIDSYLGEISPDQGLTVAKFLGVAGSLPDAARDCFDGVYRALEIFIESHPTLSAEERTRICGCLNYGKLSLEACKDLARNRRIPPGVAMRALASQQSKHQIGTRIAMKTQPEKSTAKSHEEELKLSLRRMQSRVVELEKVCRDMKGQMSRMVASSKSYSIDARGMPSVLTLLLPCPRPVQGFVLA